MALGRLAHSIELEQFVSHVFHGLLYSGLGLGPGSAAQAAQRRAHAFTRTILLDQVKPRERHIKLRAFGKLQQHELAGGLALLKLFQSLVHANAVFHVYHVVAHGQVAEVRHECGRLGLLPQGRFHHDFRIIKQVTRAKEHQMGIRQHHAIGHGSADDGGGSQVAGEVRGLVKIGLAAGQGITAAHAERHLVFGKDVGKALHLAGIGSSKHHAPVLCRELLHFFHHRWHRAVEARGGLGLELNVIG